MTHFGILCPAATGHLNPMTTLGWELQQRGHQVTLFGLLDAQSSVHTAGLAFKAIGESQFPLGAMSRIFEKQGGLSGLESLRYTMEWVTAISSTFLQEAPAAIKAAGVEALLVDQVSPEGGSIAEHLNLPFVSVASAILVWQDLNLPPYFTPWSYSLAWWAKLRNLFGYTVHEWITRPVAKLIADYRQKWQLPSCTHPNDYYSKLALITQQTVAFDFPRQNVPNHIHFTGSLANPKSRQAVDFPFEQLTEKPLIYASLGTVQNRLQSVFQEVAQACVGLEAQLVISLGSGIRAESMGNLPGSPIVVQYAPQLELLKRASLVITHAGMNTVMESLSQAVPMVAIPIAVDQPGIAARIAWTGVGKVVPLSRLGTSMLREAIIEVLTQESYQANAVRSQQALQEAGGVSRAVDIIEQAISTGN